MRIVCDMLMVERKQEDAFRVMCTLINRMASMNPAHQYLIVTARPQEYRDLVNKANIQVRSVKLQSKQGLLIQHQFLLMNMLRHIKPDLLYVPNGVAVIGWHGPLVLAIHDRSFLYEEGQDFCGYAQFCWSALLRESMHRAQAIVTTLELTYAELLASWPLGKAQVHLTTEAAAPETTLPLYHAILGAWSRHRVREEYLARRERHHTSFASSQSSSNTDGAQSTTLRRPV